MKIYHYYLLFLVEIILGVYSTVLPKEYLNDKNVNIKDFFDKLLKDELYDNSENVDIKPNSGVPKAFIANADVINMADNPQMVDTTAPSDEIDDTIDNNANNVQSFETKDRIKELLDLIFKNVSTPNNDENDENNGSTTNVNPDIDNTNTNVKASIILNNNETNTNPSNEVNTNPNDEVEIIPNNYSNTLNTVQNNDDVNTNNTNINNINNNDYNNVNNTNINDINNSNTGNNVNTENNETNIKNNNTDSNPVSSNTEKINQSLFDEIINLEKMIKEMSNRLSTLENNLENSKEKNENENIHNTETPTETPTESPITVNNIGEEIYDEKDDGNGEVNSDANANEYEIVDPIEDEDVNENENENKKYILNNNSNEIDNKIGGYISNVKTDEEQDDSAAVINNEKNQENKDENKEEYIDELVDLLQKLKTSSSNSEKIQIEKNKEYILKHLELNNGFVDINSSENEFSKYYNMVNDKMDTFLQNILNGSQMNNDNDSKNEIALEGEIREELAKLSSIATTEEEVSKVQYLIKKFNKDKLEYQNMKNVSEYNDMLNQNTEIVNNDNTNTNPFNPVHQPNGKMQVTIEDKMKKVNNENLDNMPIEALLNKIASSTTNEKEVEKVKTVIEEMRKNDIMEQNKYLIDGNLNENTSKEAATTTTTLSSASASPTTNDTDDTQVLPTEVNNNLDQSNTDYINKLIGEIASHTTNSEQVREVQEIIKQIELYQTFLENIKNNKNLEQSQTQSQPQETSTITQTQSQPQPQETTTLSELDLLNPSDLSTEFLNNSGLELKTKIKELINNAETDEQRKTILNILLQIQKHNKLIEENNGESNENINNIEENGNVLPIKNTSNIEENATTTTTATAATATEAVTEGEIDVDKIIEKEEKGNGTTYLLVAFGVIALAGLGYSGYRSKVNQYELPFSDNMDKLMYKEDKVKKRKSYFGLNYNNYGFNKSFRPSNIINTDSVIRHTSQSLPVWATTSASPTTTLNSNNKNSLKNRYDQNTDPEKLLDECIRNLENKDKKIIPSSSNNNNNNDTVIDINMNNYDDNDRNTGIKRSTSVSSSRTRSRSRNPQNSKPRHLKRSSSLVRCRQMVDDNEDNEKSTSATGINGVSCSGSSLSRTTCSIEIEDDGKTINYFKDIENKNKTSNNDDDEVKCEESVIEMNSNVFIFEKLSKDEEEEEEEEKEKEMMAEDNDSSKNCINNNEEILKNIDINMSSSSLSSINLDDDSNENDDSISISIINQQQQQQQQRRSGSLKRNNSLNSSFNYDSFNTSNQGKNNTCHRIGRSMSVDTKSWRFRDRYQKSSENKNENVIQDDNKIDFIGNNNNNNTNISRTKSSNRRSTGKRGSLFLNTLDFDFEKEKEREREENEKSYLEFKKGIEPLNCDTSFIYEDHDNDEVEEVEEEEEERGRRGRGRGRETRKNKKNGKKKEHAPRPPKRSSSCCSFSDKKKSTVTSPSSTSVILPKLDTKMKIVDCPFSAEVMEDFKRKLGEMD